MIVVTQCQGDRYWIHTLGNISKGYPELLMMTPSHQIEQYKAMLMDLSLCMSVTGATPTEHRIFAFQGHHFYPLTIDTAFVFMWAFLVTEHYEHQTNLHVLQLIIPDEKGAYPFDLDYQGTLEQPVLKYN